MVPSWGHWFQHKAAVWLHEHPEELHCLGATAAAKKRPLYPRKMNYLYLLTHHRHPHHHLTKGNLERDKKEVKQKEDGRWGHCAGWGCWCHTRDIQVMAHPSLQLHQPTPLLLLGQAQLDRSCLSWERGVKSLPVLWKCGPMSNTSPRVKCSLPHKHKRNFKLENFFLQNKLSDCFFFSFPLAFTLKTFYFTMSQNDRSAFLIHFPCIFLLTQYPPATPPFINSLFKH